MSARRSPDSHEVAADRGIADPKQLWAFSVKGWLPKNSTSIG